MEEDFQEMKRLLEDILETLKRIETALGQRQSATKNGQQQKKQYPLKDRIYFFVRKVGQKGPVRLSFLKKVFKNEKEDDIAKSLAELEKEGKVIIENDTVKLK